jgi:hypothetical protein
MTKISKTVCLKNEVLVYRVKMELKNGYFLKDFWLNLEKSATRTTMQSSLEIRTRYNKSG